MNRDHQWMTSTLFDMAAFCDRNGLDKAQAILVEAAVLLQLQLQVEAARGFLIRREADEGRGNAVEGGTVMPFVPPERSIAKSTRTAAL